MCEFCLFVCLSDLLLKVPVNSYGYVGMLPPVYATSTHQWGCMAMTSVMYVEYIITLVVNNLRILKDGLTNTFLTRFFSDNGAINDVDQ